MFPSMMIALALWAPLTPATDQAVLTQAFEHPVSVRLGFERIDPRAAAADWAGRNCSSRFTILFGGDRFAETVDWTARDLTLRRPASGDQVILRGGLSGLAGVASVEFYFASDDQARRAFLALERLRAACAPQR